jgi:hypothetical protein
LKLTGILAPTRHGSTVIARAAQVLALANSDANHAGFFEYSITIVTLELVVGIGKLTVTARLSRARSVVALSARSGRLFILHGFLSFSFDCELDLIPIAAGLSISRLGYRRTLFDGHQRGCHACLRELALFAIAAGRRHGRGATRRVPRVGFWVFRFVKSRFCSRHGLGVFAKGGVDYRSFARSGDQPDINVGPLLATLND